MQAAFAPHVCYYNWARPHASLEGKAPAMVLGITDRVWTVDDPLGLLEADEKRAVQASEFKRGAFGPRKSSN
jgi:hypothetical protein